MLKEIHEQASSLSDTIAGRLDPERGDVRLEHVALSADETAKRSARSFSWPAAPPGTPPWWASS